MKKNDFRKMRSAKRNSVQSSEKRAAGAVMGAVTMEAGSEYYHFYFSNLGYNFRHINAGLVITKAEYYRRFGPNPSDAWEMIPFEPVGGWSSEEERTKHLKQVNALRKEYQIKWASGMIPEGQRIYKSP